MQILEKKLFQLDLHVNQAKLKFSKWLDFAQVHLYVATFISRYVATHG
jgi:hypothetical protein